MVDAQSDALLTRAIEAVSARFDRECNRKFSRRVEVTEEFSGEETEIMVACYPVEAVSKFEVKTNEVDGWIEQSGVGHLIRRGGVISLVQPLSIFGQGFSAGSVLGRVTYTGGYVLPGTSPGVGQTGLPADVETAAIEQVAFWFQHRDRLGLIRYWPSGGAYMVFMQAPLLPEVTAALRPYRRWV